MAQFAPGGVCLGQVPGSGVTNVMAGSPHPNLLPRRVVRDNKEDMATLLTPARTAALRGPKAYREAVVTQVTGESTADNLIRLASLGAIAFTVAIPLVGVMAYTLQSQYIPQAAAATALYLPFYLRHVRYGLRGQRPRYLPLTLGAMAVVIVGVTPLIGSDWLFAFSALIVSVLITTPPRFSFPVVALIFVGVGIWGAVLTNEFDTPFFGGGLLLFFPLAVAIRAATVYVLVWLVGALGRVQLARAALAQGALAAERDTVDLELSQTVGAELEAVVVLGARAEDAYAEGSPDVESVLQALVEGSRRALANGREVAGRYKLSSPAADLERAASLLRAAGMEVRIELPDTALPLKLDQSLRSALQIAVAKLLREEVTDPVVLKLSSSNGQLRLDTVSRSANRPAA